MKIGIKILLRYSAALLLLFVFFDMPVLAQQNTFVLKGVVFKSNSTVVRVANVLVANLNNNAIVTTDKLGTFLINCSVGDMLLFKQKDYADQKIGILSNNTLMVFLQPVINLSTVNIKEATKKQELGQVMNEYGKRGIYNNGRPSVASALLSPLNGLYDLFSSGPKQARRFQRYSARELEQIEVDRRFNKTLLQKTTGLTGDTLQKFIDTCKPSYEDIRKWNDYELISYIKKEYQNFENNGEKSDIQKLY